MRTNPKNNRSIVRLMNELNIDDQISAVPRPIPSMTFVNKSCSQSTHRRQKQQCDRARFFYHQRQERKQRRLQQKPLTIHHDQQRVSVPMVTNQRRKRVTAIVGSSIAHRIRVRNIEDNNNEVKLRSKSGSGCEDALSWLISNEGRMFMSNVNEIIFILGTNDLHRTGAMQTVQRIGRTVEAVRNFYPGVDIVWQLLQQRTRKTWHLPEGPLVIDEINRCNEFLVDLAEKMRFFTIQPAIPIEQMHDGLHPSMYGVELMEATIRNYLQQKQMQYPLAYVNIVPLMSIHF